MGAIGFCVSRDLGDEPIQFVDPRITETQPLSKQPQDAPEHIATRRLPRRVASFELGDRVGR